MKRARRQAGCWRAPEWRLRNRHVRRKTRREAHKGYGEDRVETLAEAILAADAAYYQDDEPAMTRCGLRRAAPAPHRHRGEFPRARSRQTARAMPWALHPWAASARSPTSSRCCRSTISSADEEVSRVHRARPTLSQSESRGGDRRYGRAEDRWPVLQPALRERRAGARRNARRWRGGRGCHRQYPHVRRTCPEKLKGKRHPAAHRGARRGLHDHVGVRGVPGRRGLQPAARRPANPRNARPVVCARRIRQITRARPLRFFAYTWGDVSEPFAETQRDAVEAFKAWGLPVNPEMKRATTRRGSAQDLPRHRGAPRRRSATTSTGSSTRSTGSTGSSASASSHARRAGPPRTNSRPSRR